MKSFSKIFSGLKALPFRVKIFVVEVLPVTLGLACIIIYKYWTAGDKDREQFSVIGAGWEGSGGGFLASNIMARPISNLFRKIGQYCLPAKLLSSSDRKRYLFQEKYEKIENHISAAHKAAILDLFREWDLYAQDGAGSYGEKYEKRLTLLTGLPIHPLPPISKEKFQTEMRPKIEKLISVYSPALQRQIIGFVKDLIANINQIDDENSEKGVLRVAPILLQGPSGVGKTTLIETIAEIVGVTCKSYKLSNMSLEEIQGSYSALDDGKPGILLDVLSKSKNTNVILFLDETDKVFNAKGGRSGDKVVYLKTFLLDVLNRELSEFTPQRLQFPLRMPKLIVVMAGQSNFIAKFPDKEDREAFGTRVQVFNFSALMPKAKRDIAEQYYESLKKLYPKVASKKHAKVTDDIIYADQYPGVRVLKIIIKQYVDHVNNAEYFDDFGPSQFNIQAAYQAYEQEEMNAKAVEDNASADEKEAKEGKEKTEGAQIIPFQKKDNASLEDNSNLSPNAVSGSVKDIKTEEQTAGAAAPRTFLPLKKARELKVGTVQAPGEESRAKKHRKKKKVKNK